MTTPIVSVNLSGQKELLSALKELPDRMQKNVIRFALREAAKPILNGAKIRAPKKTGNLVKNLKIKAWKSKKNSGKIGVSVGYVVGGQAFYAHFQEFGWRFGKRPARRQLSPKKLESDIAALREELNLTSVLGGKLHVLERRLQLQKRLEQKKKQLNSAIDAQKNDKRKEIPGLFFIKRAYDDKAEVAKNSLLELMVQGLDREVKKLAKKQ